MKKASAPKKTVYRNSGSGRFTTKKAAERNPKGTERERVPTGR